MTTQLLIPSNLSKTETKICNRIIRYCNPESDITTSSMRHLLATKTTGTDSYKLYNATVKYINKLLKHNDIALFDIVVESGLCASMCAAFYKPENRISLSSEQLNKFIKYLPEFEFVTTAEQYRLASQTSEIRTNATKSAALPLSNTNTFELQIDNPFNGSSITVSTASEDERIKLENFLADYLNSYKQSVKSETLATLTNRVLVEAKKLLNLE